MAGADQREAADRIGIEPGSLDQSRRERIVRHGQEQGLFATEEIAPCRSGHRRLSWFIGALSGGSIKR